MSYPNTFNPFDQYPHSSGPKRNGLVVHAGPNPYVQIVVPSAGDSVQAVDFGLKWIDHMEGALTSDGLYRVEPVNPTDGPVSVVQLRWTVVSSGLEVAGGGAVDLSGSSVALVAKGW